jgi:DNA-directed RNA polymerase subunit RPC12/RpoP
MSKVLYVYKCAECGKRGDQHLEGDSHDGEASTCVACGASVILEWDGGVVLETPQTIAAAAISRARKRM